MKELSEIYGVHYINTMDGFNVNTRNQNLYRLDYVHGNNLRNELYGKYVSKQIEKYIFN